MPSREDIGTKPSLQLQSCHMKIQSESNSATAASYCHDNRVQAVMDNRCHLVADKTFIILTRIQDLLIQKEGRHPLACRSESLSSPARNL